MRNRKNNNYSTNIKDSSEDVTMQKEIIDRANYSLALLGRGAVYHASGRFLNISNELSDRVIE